MTNSCIHSSLRLALVAAVMLLTMCAPLSAQHLWVSAAVQRDAQRFPEDVVANRLNGSAIGWTIAASARVWRHVALVTEWSHAGTIDDVQVLTLDVNGRMVTISSSLRHRTRAWLTMAGFTHRAGGRVRVAYVAGAAFTNVRREFRSDAAGLLLVSPSTPGGAAAPPVVDRFQTPVGGVDVHMQVNEHVGAVFGLRAQPVRMTPDVNGWSMRLFAGAGWSL